LLLIQLKVAIQSIQRPIKIDNSTKKMKIKKRQLKCLITALTFFFMFTTIPSSLITGIFLQRLNDIPDISYQNKGDLIVYVLDCLAFTFHSSKFFVLLFADRRFKQETKKVFSSFRICVLCVHVHNEDI
jgi:hypothetical protein